MGDIVEIRCDHCGSSEQYMLGVGRTHHIIKVIEESFDEELQDRVHEMLLSAPEDWSFERSLGQCLSCRKLSVVPALLYRGGTEGSIHGKCDCGGELRLWTYGQIEGGDVPDCPECGVKMKAEQAGYWD